MGLIDLFKKYLCKHFNKKEVYLADLGAPLFSYTLRALLVIAVIALVYSLRYMFAHTPIEQLKADAIAIATEFGVVLIIGVIALVATFTISSITEWIDKKAHGIKIAECPNNPKKP